MRSISIVPGLLLLFHSAAFAQLGEAFEKIDADNDGRVTKAELEAAGRRSGWIALVDADGDSAVTITEAKEFFSKKSKNVPGPDAEPEFIVGEFPEGAPVTESGCRAAANYSAQCNGYSFLVMAGDKILFERYDQKWTPETPHRLASGTKSFSSAMLAAAKKDELLTLDEPVAETITEWSSDEKLATVTIRQLLSLTSGIPGGKIGAIPSYREAVVAEVAHSPGEKFSYGPQPYQIFGELMRRKLAARDDIDFADPLAYLQARIFDPIGMTYADWRRDEDEMPNLPSGAFITAREWAKFGQLLLQKGEWEGGPLLDPETLAECLQGSEANPMYGLTIWLIDPKGNPRLEGAYMAAGAGKQRLYVLPAVDLVVVRQGESKKFDDTVLLGKLLGDVE